jgi:hypothetical protein
MAVGLLLLLAALALVQVTQAGMVISVATKYFMTLYPYVVLAVAGARFQGLCLFRCNFCPPFV